MNQTLSLIASRRSHRAYESTPLTKEQLNSIMAAALQSPSARNLQPWHFTVVSGQNLLDQMDLRMHAFVLGASQNARSPRFEEKGYHVFYHAPTVVFLAGDPHNPWSQVDCGIAVQNIALAAESLGLGSVIIGMIRDFLLSSDADDLKKTLAFPDGYEFVIAIALGVAADDKAAHPVRENKVVIL